MAEISLIVPVYKVEQFLPRCVKSVLSQSFRDLELILVDDGSPDGCPALCDAYARQDPRVHVIHRENGGLSAARNTGLSWALSHSDSSWVMFLDSDDWIHRDCLLRLLTAQKDTGADLSLCRFCRVDRMQEDRELGPVSPLILTPEEAYETYYGLCMTACCKLIPRESLKNLQFPEGKLHEDCFVTHELVFAARKICILPEDLYYYYFNPNSITRADWKPERLQELEAHEVRLEFLQKHGYLRAEKAERKVLIQTVYEHIEVLAAGKNPAYRQQLQNLRKKLRALLKENKGLIPVNGETFWMYLMAWPCKGLWVVLKKAQEIWHRRNS